MKLAGESSVYYDISRVSRGTFLFEDAEKERMRMRELLWRVSRYCGVEVITYACMGNHVHLLIRVPEKTKADLAVTDAELLLRVAELKNDLTVGMLRVSAEKFQERETALASGAEVSEELEKMAKDWPEMRQRFLAQKHDLSGFMKFFLQRFTMYFNKRHATFGGLWADRFKSQLVEDRGTALRMVAAYIDLNGVRAGLAEDPKDYRFCGYAEAVAGNKDLQAQMVSAMNGGAEPTATPGTAEWDAYLTEGMAKYRVWLMQAGTRVPGSEKKANGVGEEVKEEAIAAQGKLTQAEVLRHRVRYFMAGAAIGGGEFVERVFLANRQRFGKKRETGQRRMTGAEWGALRVLRDLKSRVIGK